MSFVRSRTTTRPRYTGPDDDTRTLVYTRDGGCCVRCGEPVPQRLAQCHHRRPRGMGGTQRPDANSPANLLTLCLSCHDHIEKNRAEAYMSGWLIGQTSDPLGVPVLIGRGSRWCYLTADGRYADDPVAP